MMAADAATPWHLEEIVLTDRPLLMAGRLIPASDVSTPISTECCQQDGTSHMTFVINGAPTISTRGGATIEIIEEAGDHKFGSYSGPYHNRPQITPNGRTRPRTTTTTPKARLHWS